MLTPLPEPFARWFASRGWAPRAHQLELLAKARAGRSVLLIAPTGAGKTLAGFLPSLVELSTNSPRIRSAPSPHSPSKTGVNALMTGEGWGGGSRSDAPELPHRTTPTPNPSPQGGGEQNASGGSEKRRLFSTGRHLRREGGPHTLYISPRRGLAADIARNLQRPFAGMRPPARIETRTRDAPAS